MPDVNETMELPMDIPTEDTLTSKKLEELCRWSKVPAETKVERTAEIDKLKDELLKLVEKHNG